jgi:diguanylate cyclase (GGDEF)-like protein
MLAVLALDGAGYYIAVRSVGAVEPSRISLLQDIFVAVAILTITVGLVLPGMIAHGATAVATAADGLAKGALADLTRAMKALAEGDLESARVSVDVAHVEIRSADEIGAMASSFNVILDEAARVATSLDGARQALVDHRFELQALIIAQTIHSTQQTAVAELGRSALRSSDIDLIADLALDALTAGLRAQRAVLIKQDSPASPFSKIERGGPNCGPDPEIFPADDDQLRVLFAEQLPVRLQPRRESSTVAHAGVWAQIITQRAQFGGLAVYTDSAERSFSDADLGFVGAIASVVGSAVDRIRAEDELTRQALHDPLTGLPNRVLFADRVGLALRRMSRDPSMLSVLFVDVDQFKVINDSLGHEKGDRLLVLIAQRLEQAVRVGDTVARFGGDEFIILAERVGQLDEVTGIAERIHAAASEPVMLDGRNHFVTVSTGIAICSTPDVTYGDLLRDADAAMYQAKAAGRNRTAVFTDAMHARALYRFETELELRAAIAGGQLCLHYQPIIDLTTGTISGVEALVRWNHPTHGLVPPAAFIDIAEETGLIVPLGEWVLGEACRQAQAWRSQPELEALTMSVNLSGRQIAQSDLIAVVSNILSASELPPQNLVLEITESVLMVDAEASIRILADLKRLGLRLSIDDFGTGYSSLSYLRKFPADILKVDKSFVDGLGNEDDARAIVQATINLAHSLGLTTIGEGVETEAQREQLVDLGCDKAQGYLFFRPQLATDITKILLRVDHRDLPTPS